MRAVRGCVKQLVSDLICKRFKTGPWAHKRTKQHTRPCTHDDHALPCPTTPQEPSFQPTPGCHRVQTAQPHQLAATTEVARIGRPGAARGPSQRYRGRLQTPTTHPMRHASAQGPCRLRRAPQHVVGPLLGHPALDLRRESAAEIRHPAQTATADFVHLHQTHQASSSTTYYNSAMRRDAGGSAAPVRASPAPVQPQKPKTVSRGRAGPAGRRGRRRESSGTHPKSPPIAARTEIPSALVPTATSAAS